MPTISTLTVDVESRTSKFSSGLKLAVGGLAALAAGAAYAFHQFEESEKVVQQTGAVIESTGGAANVTAKQVDALGDAMSRQSGIDDEVIQSGENVLLTFRNIANEAGKGNDIFNQATQAITDLSVAMGQDFKTSAIQVGKALNDPIAGLTNLSRIGVQFSEGQKQQIANFVKHNNLLGAQKIILAELSAEFSGSAAAQKTASQTMATALGNLAETIGGLLAPALTFVADKLTFFVNFLQTQAGPALQAVQQWFQGVWEKVQPLAEGIANVLVPAFQSAWDSIQKNLIPGLKKLWDVFQPVIKVVGVAIVLFGTVLVAQVAILVTAISKLIGWLGDLALAFKAVVDWVRENFIGPIVGAIQTVIDKIGDAIHWVKERFLAAWRALPEPIRNVITGILGWIGKLIAALETLIRLTQSWAENLAQAAVAAGVFNDVNVPGTGGKGGPHGPGPHGVSLPALAGTAATVVHVYGDVLTEGQLVDKIDEGLRRKRLRNGRLALEG